MVKRFTKEDFIKKCNIIHNNLYDYSQVLYTNMHTKVKIIDPEFGEFWQTPMAHINGQNHPRRGRIICAEKRRMTIEEFINMANKRHNCLYDYSKVMYVDCDTKVCIIDPKYGEFWQTPYNHLRNHGCPERTKNKDWVIHKDHIVPLSVICTQKRSDAWVKNRPLYKFLNSDINLQSIDAKENRKKYDIIKIKNKEISASQVRNNYDIIKYVCLEKLGIDVTDIIEKDKIYISETLGF